MGSNNPRKTSRRRYLKYATVPLAGLAGCSGDGTDGDGNGGGDGDGGDTATATPTGTVADGYETEIKMTSALSYEIDTMRIMFQELKENIEEETNGEITVQTFPEGQLGGDTGNVRLVQQGNAHLASSSFQNLSSFAPVSNIISLPMFTRTSQELINLVTSDVWATEVEERIRENNIEALAYAPFDTRMMGLGPKYEGQEPPVTPDEFQNANITHRVAGSDITKTAFSDGLGLDTTALPWGEVATSLEQGVIDSSYNFIGGQIWGGFAELIYHTVVFRATPDAQLWIANAEWLDSLPEGLREDVRRAGEKTTQQSIAADDALEFRETAFETYLNEYGHNIVWPTQEQEEALKEAIHYDRNRDSLYSDWIPDLAGSEETLEQLEEAVRTPTDFRMEESMAETYERISGETVPDFHKTIMPNSEE